MMYGYTQAADPDDPVVAAQQAEAQAYVQNMHDYSNMGEGKPISTEWHRTGRPPKTINGSQHYHWICLFCGEEAWAPWGKLDPHECHELDSHFNQSTGEQTPGGTQPRSKP